jgi:hypothetical protein
MILFFYPDFYRELSSLSWKIKNPWGGAIAGVKGQLDQGSDFHWQYESYF